MSYVETKYWGVWNRSGPHDGLTTDDRVLIGDFDYGPFDSREEADAFVESLGRFGENKWVARIRRPTTQRAE